MRSSLGILFFLIVLGLLEVNATNSTIENAEPKRDKYLENGFFASREDNKRQATCISKKNNFYNRLDPGYDLNKLQLHDGGFTWNWASEWELTNMEPDLKRWFKNSGKQYAFTDGSKKFQKLFSSEEFNYTNNRFAALASNASLWIFESDENNLEDKGFLLQIDHLNDTSGMKFSRAMKCQQMPENKEQEDNCETLAIKENTNILKDGNDGVVWMRVFNASDDIHQLETWSKADVIQNLNWTWPTQKNRTTYTILVRTHKRPGVIYFELTNPLKASTVSNSKMSRNFSQLSTGKFCIKTYGTETCDHEWLNLDTQQVESSGKLHRNLSKEFITLEFDSLKPGNYQLTFQNINETGYIYTELCASERISKEPMPPVTPDHCDLIDRKILPGTYVHNYTNSLTQTINTTLKTNWSADDLAYVCDQLKVPEDKQLAERENFKFKFCNALWGCNFDFCPQKEPLLQFQQPPNTLQQPPNTLQQPPNTLQQPPNTLTHSGQSGNKNSISIFVLIFFYVLALYI